MIGYLRSCPSCGAHHDGDPYDIGSGPEFNCHQCDWCWGALGQDLTPLPAPELHFGEDGRPYLTSSQNPQTG